MSATTNLIHVLDWSKIKTSTKLIVGGYCLMQAIFGCFVRCRKLQVVHIQHGLKLSIYSPYSLPSHRKHQIHLHLYNTQFWCDDNLLALQKYRFVTSHTSYTYTRKQTHTQCGQYGMYIRTESRVILTRMSRCR